MKPDSTTTVGDLIMQLRDLDPNLPIGIACSPLSTPEDNLTRLTISVEQHGTNQVVLCAKDMHLLYADNDDLNTLLLADLEFNI